MKSAVLALLCVACTGNATVDPDDVDGGSEAGKPDAAPAFDAVPPDAAGPPVLPIFMLEVADEIPDGDKVPGRLVVIERHDGSHEDLASAPRAFDGDIGIELRGNTSLMFPKHSYSMETRGASGEDADVALLGLPADSDWVLFAPYNDKTLMRDRLAYDLGAALAGAWAPRTRYIELYLNDEYVGVYVLIERIKRGKARVDIPKVAPDASGDLSGGYIIKLEGSDPGDWESARETPWQYHYPKRDDITPDQAEYLRQYVDGFEAGMLSAAFDYPALIDVPSFVDFVIVTELSRNIDGYRKSAYFYKQPTVKGGKLYMGPIWDFNLAFGNADYCQAAVVEGFQYTRDACEDVEQIARWWPRLMASPPFAKAVRCRWDSLRAGVYSDASLQSLIAGYRETLEAAQPRDQAVWKTLGEYIWPNPFVGETWDEEIDYMRGWLLQRAAWLDAHLAPGACP